MERTIIEVNGAKLEVDLRTAKRVDTLRVGDRVKVLVKNYSDYSIYPGVVVGFEPFEKLPTIIIAYMNLGYQSVELKFVYFNAKSTDVEVVKAVDNDQLDIDKAKMLEIFDLDIKKREEELAGLHRKKEFFLREFRKYWEYEAIKED